MCFVENYSESWIKGFLSRIQYIQLYFLTICILLRRFSSGHRYLGGILFPLTTWKQSLFIHPFHLCPSLGNKGPINSEKDKYKQYDPTSGHVRLAEERRSQASSVCQRKERRKKNVKGRRKTKGIGDFGRNSLFFFPSPLKNVFDTYYHYYFLHSFRGVLRRRVLGCVPNVEHDTSRFHGLFPQDCPLLDPCHRPRAHQSLWSCAIFQKVSA